MLLLCFLCLLWVLATANRCALNHTSHTASPILESLQCYNDYLSFFHCKWREEPERQSNGRLKLWLSVDNLSGLCEDYASDEKGFSQCRYKTTRFSLLKMYTAFFNETVSPCPSAQTMGRDLSVLLRPRAPVNLTTSNTEDSGWLITWSSPYPQFSSLNNNITYQLSYRPDDQDNWMSEELSDNQKKLEKKTLIPGHRYEARVRAQIRMGQWSHWSSIVSWNTHPDVETAPPVDCVLWGEQEVQCRWEQSIELVHFISYQLHCGHSHTALMEVCCEKPAVDLEHREDWVRFTCLLTQPVMSSLQVKLVPTRSTKSFQSGYHIRPNPPTNVKVKESGNNWIVEWTPIQIKTSSPADIAYEICYNSEKMEKGDVCTELRSFNGIYSLTVLDKFLLPSQKYWVKVRSHVLPPYKGTPSDWSSPAEWTSHAAVWPMSYWIYISVAAFVPVVLFAVFIIPACKRKTLLWELSVPSPGKSKVILDIQTVNDCKIMLSEKTYLCKVLEMDSLSTCSSQLSLWPTKSPDLIQGEKPKEEEVDDGIWSCENLSNPLMDKSSMSFTGPYILCQTLESNPREDISEQTEEPCPDVEGPATVRTVSFEDGYVCLPSHTVSTSVQDLTSQSHGSTEEELSNSSTENQHCRNEDYTSNTFWPQGGAIQGLGYCQLPIDFSKT